MVKEGTPPIFKKFFFNKKLYISVFGEKRALRKTATEEPVAQVSKMG